MLCNLLRRDEIDVPKIGPEAGAVARDQVVALHRGLRPDVEVRATALPCLAALSRRPALLSPQPCGWHSS